jgi:hypothetical protein
MPLWDTAKLKNLSVQQAAHFLVFESSLAYRIL